MICWIDLQFSIFVFLYFIIHIILFLYCFLNLKKSRLKTNEYLESSIESIEEIYNSTYLHFQMVCSNSYSIFMHIILFTFCGLIFILWLHIHTLDFFLFIVDLWFDYLLCLNVLNIIILINFVWLNWRSIVAIWGLDATAMDTHLSVYGLEFQITFLNFTLTGKIWWPNIDIFFKIRLILIYLSNTDRFLVLIQLLNIAQIIVANAIF